MAICSQVVSIFGKFTRFGYAMYSAVITTSRNLEMVYRVSKKIVLFEAVLTISVFLVGVIMLGSMLSELNIAGIVFFSIWVFFTGKYSYNLKDNVTGVELNEGKKINLISMLSRREKSISDLEEIRMNFGGGYVEFCFSDEKIGMLSNIDDLSELVVSLKKINTSIRTKGV